MRNDQDFVQRKLDWDFQDVDKDGLAGGSNKNHSPYLKTKNDLREF